MAGIAAFWLLKRRSLLVYSLWSAPRLGRAVAGVGRSGDGFRGIARGGTPRLDEPRLRGYGLAIIWPREPCGAAGLLPRTDARGGRWQGPMDA